MSARGEHDHNDPDEADQGGSRGRPVSGDAGPMRKALTALPAPRGIPTASVGLAVLAVGVIEVVNVSVVIILDVGVIDVIHVALV